MDVHRRIFTLLIPGFIVLVMTVTISRITNSIIRDNRGQIDGLLVQMCLLADEIANIEAPEIAPYQEPQLADLPEQRRGKRSNILNWAMIEATVAVSGLLGIIMLAVSEAGGETIGTPPELQELA